MRKYCYDAENMSRI